MEDLCPDCAGKTINRSLCFRFILVPCANRFSSYAIVLRELFVVLLESVLRRRRRHGPPTLVFVPLLRIWIRGNSLWAKSFVRNDRIVRNGENCALKGMENLLLCE